MKDETKSVLRRLGEKLREYRYPALVLLLGLVLLLLPSGEKEEDPAELPAAGSEKERDAPRDELEARLEEILSMVEGAGQVRVLLSPETSGERVLARDDRGSMEEGGGETRREWERSAVIVSGSGQEEAVESVYRYPVYRGAVIAAEGADSAAVRLALLNAVKAATGLTADAVEIVKLR